MKGNREYVNRLLQDNVDESIINYVKESLVKLDNQLEIAIGIYIKLCKIFSYSTKFVVDQDYSLVEDLSKITIDNSEVVCLHWAIIYSKLLGMYGIENELVGDDSHIYVKVSVDNYVIRVDAVEYGNVRGKYIVSDLALSKMGLKIKSFNTMSKAKNEQLSEIIDEVYRKLNIELYNTEKFERVLNKFKKYLIIKRKNRLMNNENLIDREDIISRIKFVNYFYNLGKDVPEVEKTQFFIKYCAELFEGFDCFNFRSVSLKEYDNNYGLLRLIVCKDGNGNCYYFLESKNGFIEYTKEEIMDEIQERNLYFKDNVYGCLGFESNEIRKAKNL